MERLPEHRRRLPHARHERGKALMRAEINTRTSTRIPSCPTKLMTLGRTLKPRAGDILAYFDHPHNHRRPY